MPGGFRRAGEGPIRTLGRRVPVAGLVRVRDTARPIVCGNGTRLWGTRPAMQSGFNTNIRHRGVLFHVQTEDSGISNPHVITHLFHGGNIMASEKRTYSEQLGSENLGSIVRGLMESQHKAMLKGLRAGMHDDAILVRLGPEVFNPDASDVVDASDMSDPRDTVAALPAGAPPPADAAATGRKPASAEQSLARAFGDGVVSEKPLDEVVLDYLVENARKRKQRAK